MKGSLKPNSLSGNAVNQLEAPFSEANSMARNCIDDNWDYKSDTLEVVLSVMMNDGFVITYSPTIM